MKNSYFNQFIQHKALSFKLSNSDLAEKILDTDSPSKWPNVCAKLHPDVVKDFHDVCSFLNVSKRKFIEVALIDALQRARDVIADVDVFEDFEDDEIHRVEAAVTAAVEENGL